ncbi:MAG: TipAS antibiotic-recognition domain-containing protein [Actinomycetota bacterium]
MLLARISHALEGDGFTLKDPVSAQLQAVDAALIRARRLRRRLQGILEVLERSDDPSVEELTQIMEVVTMHEKYYTPEQLEARRQEVGDEQIQAIEREWAELSAAMKGKRDAGVEPSDPEVRALAERWASLTERTIAGFTGGDPAIASSLGRMYQEEGPEKASRGTFDADLLEYVTRAQMSAD